MFGLEWCIAHKVKHAHHLHGWIKNSPLNIFPPCNHERSHTDNHNGADALALRVHQKDTHVYTTNHDTNHDTKKLAPRMIYRTWWWHPTWCMQLDRQQCYHLRSAPWLSHQNWKLMGHFDWSVNASLHATLMLCISHDACNVPCKCESCATMAMLLFHGGRRCATSKIGDQT